MDKTDNPLKNAPHTQIIICADEWNHAMDEKKQHSRCLISRANKFWPSIGRVNNTYGDRNLVCTCEPVRVMKNC